MEASGPERWSTAAFIQVFGSFVAVVAIVVASAKFRARVTCAGEEGRAPRGACGHVVGKQAAGRHGQVVQSTQRRLRQQRPEVTAWSQDSVCDAPGARLALVLEKVATSWSWSGIGTWERVAWSSGWTWLGTVQAVQTLLPTGLRLWSAWLDTCVDVEVVMLVVRGVVFAKIVRKVQAAFLSSVQGSRTRGGSRLVNWSSLVPITGTTVMRHLVPLMQATSENS
mmetsp:Transcript_18797/g.65537  ORF Transcript_18797/g.65537 Transcript_18797/m.65537 type:complete len:224 (-) Transcript_18797:758-1429(-)